MQRCPHCGRSMIGQRDDHPELCELQARIQPRITVDVPRDLFADLGTEIRILGRMNAGIVAQA